MAKIRILTSGEGFREADGLDGLKETAADPRTVVWVLLQKPAQDELAAVADAFDLHHTTMDDLDEGDDRPHIRQYDNAVSIVFFAVREVVQDDNTLGFAPLHLFAGARFVVSVTNEAMPELDEAYNRWKDQAKRLPADGGAPLYTILDTLVDGYFPMIDAIADRVDDVEDRVVDKADPTALGSIFALKKGMLRFRRIASASRDVVNALMRHDGICGEGNSVYFQDLYDHVVRITDSVDTYRDLLSNAMDTYLSSTSNRLAESANKLNVTMQTLTSWSIILGTGAFVTGIYGMNVEGIPFAHSRHGFIDSIFLMIGVAALLLALFRRKQWI